MSQSTANGLRGGVRIFLHDLHPCIFLVQHFVPSSDSHAVIPWGRFRGLRPDLLNATRAGAEGGTGRASKFWDWCEVQVQEYL